MSETLYIQTEKNVKIYEESVHLEDIAKLSASDEHVLARNRALHILTLPKGKPGRYVINAMDLVQAVQKKEDAVDVVHMGETEMILTLETGKNPAKLWTGIKTLFICLITFFGAGFSIMTFNTDVDTSGLFQNVYEWFTGQPSNGFTVLEWMYSVGIGIGVIFFFNHFGKTKLTQDPTPMEVQMRLYEDDVNTTILEQNKREGKSK
ncbi:MAG: stage V sporulation protein AA [Lachnospiraceae bacterium]|nr:stage V sporulation protein AA [Lachnospiraceae bacterium]